MHGPSWTNQELIKENAALKQRIRELEASGSGGMHSEESFHESEAHFCNSLELAQLLIDTSPMFVVAIGFDGKTLMMNKALLDTLEYSMEEIKGTDYLTAFVPEEEWEMLTGVFQKIIRKGNATINENRIRSRSGKTYPVEWHGRPGGYKERTRDFFVGIGIDISARKRAEEMLQQERDELDRRVVDRTKELNIINLQLSNEIADRKQVETDLQKSRGSTRTFTA
ncbi:MAG: hypothetical protein CSYNP_00724 [Syntrophus sp. SKADARSKE-3]|nr:hypothetical protein [Syntrophus sp. SKADARSKE-3]